MGDVFVFAMDVFNIANDVFKATFNFAIDAFKATFNFVTGVWTGFNHLMVLAINAVSFYGLRALAIAY